LASRPTVLSSRQAVLTKSTNIYRLGQGCDTNTKPTQGK